MRCPVLIAVLLSGSMVFGQQLGLKFTQNVTSFPITGSGELFQAPIHPGVGLTYVHPWIERGRHEWVPNADLNFVYHRLFQHSIALNAGLDYRLRFARTWKLQAGLSGGYLHSFYQYERFELQDGKYEKIPGWKGKSQFDLGLDIAVSKRIHSAPDLDLYLEYAPYVHGVFAKSYVPVVPYNSLGIGILCQLPSGKTK